MKKLGDAAKAACPVDQKPIYKEIEEGLFDRGPYAFPLEEVAYVKGRQDFLPVIGALDNQTRYSPPKPT